MNIGIKLIIFWIASLVLFAGAGIVSLFFPDWLSGVQGLFILFFLGYCSIIVVAQAFAFLEILCRWRKYRPEEKRRYDPEIESAEQF
jgi:hypothetical protein